MGGEGSTRTSWEVTRYLLFTHPSLTFPVQKLGEGRKSAPDEVPTMSALARAGLSPRSMLSRYSSLLVERPIRTKTATSLTIAACGDILVQSSAVSTSESVDVGRTARQSSFSMVMAPAAHVWFGYLARYKPATAVLIDQLTFAPAANVLYLSWSFALRQRTLRGLMEELEGKLLPALKASYAVWPAALLLNFSFVPLRFRVLFTNCVGFGYGAWMTFLANDCVP